MQDTLTIHNTAPAHALAIFDLTRKYDLPHTMMWRINHSGNTGLKLHYLNSMDLLKPSKGVQTMVDVDPYMMLQFDVAFHKSVKNCPVAGTINKLTNSISPPLLNGDLEGLIYAVHNS